MSALLKRPKKEDRRKSSGDPDDFRLTLVEHLEELRNRIVRAITIITIAWVIGWFIEPYLYEFLNNMMKDAVIPVLPKGSDFKEVFHNATDMFMLKLKLSFVIGLVMVFPFLVLEIWGFIAPRKSA